MFDQSFSPINFYKIILSENRKGENIEKKFFNHIYETYTLKIAELNLKIAELNLKIKTTLNNFIKNDIKNRRPSKKVYSRYKRFLKYYKNKLKQEKEKLKQKKENALLDILEEISKKIQNKNFSFNLSTDTFNGKTVYKIGNTPEEFFAIKQLQYNLKKLYKIKQANRFDIVNQLKNLLEDNFPKCIIKTDIKSFFESIPNDKIISQLQKDNLLSPKSKTLIKNIIKEFLKIANTTDQQGIPRGIGISAYLSEYYMRKVDEKIKKLPNLLYYARYVDDIIIIFVPESEKNSTKYFSKIKNIIEQDFLLKINYKKTQIIKQYKKDKKDKFTLKTFKKKNKNTLRLNKKNENSVSIDYLGYTFLLLGNKLDISITNNKIKRYKKKIQLSFEEYCKYKNKRKAYQHLRDRLKFLTQNYRLHNNKNHILSGIYFSNMLCPETVFLDVLKNLDKYLKWYLSRYIKNPYHKKQLSKFSFENGYKTIAFTKFTKKQIKNLTRIWKNV